MNISALQEETEFLHRYYTYRHNLNMQKTNTLNILHFIPLRDIIQIKNQEKKENSLAVHHSFTTFAGKFFEHDRPGNHR